MGGLHDIKKKDWERLLKKNGFVLDRTNKHHE
jgi:predicted RNA binding protein YcfA (HicA-like mRNA interferase family)